MDFYDGSWDEEVTVRDESGAAVTIPFSTSAYDVWSGCEDDGTERLDARCIEWVGHHEGGDWTAKRHQQSWPLETWF